MNTSTLTLIIRCLFLFYALGHQGLAYSDQNKTTPIAELSNTQQDGHQQPVLSPTPPRIQAPAYILIDVNSGRVLAERNSIIIYVESLELKVATNYSTYD